MARVLSAFSSSKILSHLSAASSDYWLCDQPVAGVMRAKSAIIRKSSFIRRAELLQRALSKMSELDIVGLVMRASVIAFGSLTHVSLNGQLAIATLYPCVLYFLNIKEAFVLRSVVAS